MASSDNSSSAADTPNSEELHLPISTSAADADSPQSDESSNSGAIDTPSGGENPSAHIEETGPTSERTLSNSGTTYPAPYHESGANSSDKDHIHSPEGQSEGSTPTDEKPTDRNNEALNLNGEESFDQSEPEDGVAKLDPERLTSAQCIGQDLERKLIEGIQKDLATLEKQMPELVTGEFEDTFRRLKEKVTTAGKNILKMREDILELEHAAWEREQFDKANRSSAMQWRTKKHFDDDNESEEEAEKIVKYGLGNVEDFDNEDLVQRELIRQARAEMKSIVQKLKPVKRFGPEKGADVGLFVNAFQKSSSQSSSRISSPAPSDKSSGSESSDVDDNQDHESDAQGFNLGVHGFSPSCPITLPKFQRPPMPPMLTYPHYPPFSSPESGPRVPKPSQSSGATSSLATSEPEPKIISSLGTLESKLRTTKNLREPTIAGPISTPEPKPRATIPPATEPKSLFQPKEPVFEGMLPEPRLEIKEMLKKGDELFKRKLSGNGTRLERHPKDLEQTQSPGSATDLDACFETELSSGKGSVGRALNDPGKHAPTLSDMEHSLEATHSAKAKQAPSGSNGVELSNDGGFWKDQYNSWTHLIAFFGTCFHWMCWHIANRIEDMWGLFGKPVDCGWKKKDIVWVPLRSRYIMIAHLTLLYNIPHQVTLNKEKKIWLAANGMTRLYMLQYMEEVSSGSLWLRLERNLADWNLMLGYSVVVLFVLVALGLGIMANLRCWYKDLKDMKLRIKTTLGLGSL